MSPALSLNIKLFFIALEALILFLYKNNKSVDDRDMVALHLGARFLAPKNLRKENGNLV